MQTHIQNRMSSEYPTVSDLEQQNLHVRTAEQVLTKPDMQPVPQAKKIDTFADQFKNVQDKLAQEAEAAKASIVGVTKSKPIVRDARKILESYKASKAIKEPENKEMTPLDYLRDFTINKKKIVTNSTHIWFGSVSFPRTCKTNVKATFKSEYYTLNTLFNFISFNHEIGPYTYYAQAAQRSGVLAVQQIDSQELYKYLTDMNYPKPKIVEEKTHLELNPPVPVQDALTEWKEKHVLKRPLATGIAAAAAATPSKLSRMDENELIAQAQLQLQAQVQQPPPPIKEKRKSRFDLAVHPTKGFSQQPPPISSMSSLDPLPLNIQSPFTNPFLLQQLPPKVVIVQPPVVTETRRAVDQDQYQRLHQQWQQEQESLRRDSSDTWKTRGSDPFAQQQAQHVNPFDRKPVDPFEPNRSSYDDRSRSPTFERMNEPRSRSPSQREDTRSKDNHYDPFNPTESPPPPPSIKIDRSSISNPFGQLQVNPVSEQEGLEAEQQRLWEEFKREREMKKMLAEAEADNEVKRLRDSENEIAKIRLQQRTEMERIRKRNEMIETLRLKELELKRLRMINEMARLREAEKEKLVSEETETDIFRFV